MCKRNYIIYRVCPGSNTNLLLESFVQDKVTHKMLKLFIVVSLTIISKLTFSTIWQRVFEVFSEHMCMLYVYLKPKPPPILPFSCVFIFANLDLRTDNETVPSRSTTVSSGRRELRIWISLECRSFDTRLCFSDPRGRETQTLCKDVISLLLNQIPF